jgi:acylphosphatase
MADAAESRRVLYSGRVQGVGFRYTTREVAQSFAITGFVRNLRSGRVELVAEGAPAELDRFLAAVAEKMAGYIKDYAIERGPPSGKLTTFEIRSLAD